MQRHVSISKRETAEKHFSFIFWRDILEVDLKSQ